MWQKVQQNFEKIQKGEHVEFEHGPLHSTARANQDTFIKKPIIYKSREPAAEVVQKPAVEMKIQ